MLGGTCPHPPAPSPAGEGEPEFFLFPSPTYGVHTSLKTPSNSPLRRGRTRNLVPAPLQGEG